MRDAIDTFIAIFITSTLVAVGLSIGNTLGDQATLKDCATRGVAKLAGGGSITCAVVREPDQAKN